jgi:hypothetical protein
VADTKVSALTAASVVADANEFGINESGVSKKVTALQLAAYIGESVRNASTSDQTISAATAYVVGSNLAVPVGKLKIGTVLRWRLAVTKTGAGTTAGCAVIVKLGTAGSTADTSVLTFTFGTPTGVIDTAYFDVEVVCRGPLSASGVLAGIARMTHNLAATGFSTLPAEAIAVVSSAFDVTTANLIAGLTITTTTASAWTVKLVTAEAKNL